MVHWVLYYMIKYYGHSGTDAGFIDVHTAINEHCILKDWEGEWTLAIKSALTWNPYTKLQGIILLKIVILIYITVKTSNPINVCLHYEHNNSSVSIVTSYWVLWLISLETKLKEKVPNKVIQLTLAELQEPVLNFLLSAWWNPALLHYAHTPPDDLPSPCAGKMLNSMACVGTANTPHMLHGYNWHTVNSKIVLHDWQFGHCSLSLFFPTICQ